jgi:hypothetical protein
MGVKRKEVVPNFVLLKRPKYRPAKVAWQREAFFCALAQKAKTVASVPEVHKMFDWVCLGALLCTKRPKREPTR